MNSSVPLREMQTTGVRSKDNRLEVTPRTADVFETENDGRPVQGESPRELRVALDAILLYLSTSHLAQEPIARVGNRSCESVPD